MRPPPLPRSLLLSFALAGAPLAWIAQHLVGIAFSLARCDPAGHGSAVAPQTETVVATACASTIALLATASAVKLFRDTRHAPSAPPAGRVHFLATVALTIGPLFICIILMSGLGAAALDTCRLG